MELSFHEMSGALKSPPKMKTDFLLAVLSLELSSYAVFRYASSVLEAGCKRSSSPLFLRINAFVHLVSNDFRNVAYA